MSQRHLVDTHVLLRFLSGQPVKQAEAARRLFETAASGEATLEVSPVIVAETLYTLISFYEVERRLAAEKVLALLGRRGVKVRDAEQVFGALRRLQLAHVGIADAFLAAGAEDEGILVASFDRDFDKFEGIKRFEPE